MQRAMRKTGKQSANRRGFTLLELAIALMLTGLIAGIAYKFTAVSNRGDCYTTAHTQAETVKSAIERFALKNDRFPMPARRNVGVESPEYGREAAASDLDTVSNADGTVAVFGAVPLQVLGIPVANGVDCWGNKLTYVVTQALTDSTTFLVPATKGALNIKTDNTAAIFLQGAGYAVISHGEDALGAVKSNYSTTTNTPADRKWCPSGATITTQNCDVTNTELVDGTFNDGKDSGANYFDDVIVYRGPPWRARQSSNAYFWGINTNGAVGVGDTVPHALPILVHKNITFVSISAGLGHSCGISNDYKAYCWGDNQYGQLGDGTIIPRTEPVEVATGTYMAISAGYQYTCALGMNGKAYCWGRGDHGQLGNNMATTESHFPVQVAGVEYSQISAGVFHTCALIPYNNGSGNAFCWGDNTFGQLGNDPFGLGPMTAPTPQQVILDNAWGGASVTYGTIAAGSHYGDGGFSCSITSGGDPFCWGGGYNRSPQPVDVGALPLPDQSFSKIDGGSNSLKGDNICGLTTSGDAICWGGSSSNHPLPSVIDVSTLPPGDRKFVDISVGHGEGLQNKVPYVCALTPRGAEYCWGYDTVAKVMTTPTLVTGTGTDPLIFSSITTGADTNSELNGALTGTPPHINGGWGPWSACTGCSGSFGVKTRVCTLPGNTCSGPASAFCVGMGACPPPPAPPGCGATSNSCSSGVVNGFTPGACGTTDSWKCINSSGGSTSCSAANAPCVVAPPKVDAVCGAAPGTCSPGSSLGSVHGDCGTTDYWACIGTGGGASQSCSYTNAACPGADVYTLGPCNGACGGGAGTQVKTCVSGSCYGTPPTTQACVNPTACPAGIWTKNVGNCSLQCGGGTRTVTYTCVGAGGCVGGPPGPDTTEACNTDPCPATGIFIRSPGPCSVACGGGKQTIYWPCRYEGECHDANGTSVSFGRETTEDCNSDPCGAWVAPNPASCSYAGQTIPYTCSAMPCAAPAPIYTCS